MSELARLAIHTQTTRRWTLRECCERYAAAGVGGIGVWRHLVDPAAGGVTPEEGARIIRDHGLRVPSLVRGGFFVAADASTRRGALDESRRAVEEAATIGADHVVVVAGAAPDVPLRDAREQVADALSALAPDAGRAGVRLALEPLHPMYAADRSCVNTLRDANDLVERIDHAALGVAVDVYHVWWEPDVEPQIERCARDGRLLGFHVCDWRASPRDPLNDRGLMGDGCIDVRSFRRLVESTGFEGLHEVEVFSDEYWSMEPNAYLALIVQRYRDHVLG